MTRSCQVLTLPDNIHRQELPAPICSAQGKCKLERGERASPVEMTLSTNGSHGEDPFTIPGVPSPASKQRARSGGDHCISPGTNGLRYSEVSRQHPCLHLRLASSARHGELPACLPSNLPPGKSRTTEGTSLTTSRLDCRAPRSRQPGRSTFAQDRNHTIGSPRGVRGSGTLPGARRYLRGARGSPDQAGRTADGRRRAAGCLVGETRSGLAEARREERDVREVDW